VCAVVLLVPDGARPDQAALHSARCPPALSSLGVSDNTPCVSSGDGFHDVPSSDGTAAAVFSRYIDHDFGPADLRALPQAGRPAFRDCSDGPRLKMRHFKKIAVAAAAIFVATASPVHAADKLTADDTARFLAGMPPSAGSPLTALTSDPSWQRHARFFDSAFGQLEQRQLSRIRAWADINLAAPKPTMFYMFSGPDFLYADAFYSKATTYVLSALEPVGSVPDLTRLPRAGARQQPDQERLVSVALRQFHHGAQFPARQQRHHHPGRFRHSAGRLQSEEMAALSVRPLRRPDRRIHRKVPGRIRRPVQAE